GACPSRIRVAAEREPAARQHFQITRSRAPGDEDELFASCEVEQELDRGLRLPGLEQCGGEIGGRLGRVEVAVGILAEVEALLRGRERKVHVPAPERR